MYLHNFSDTFIYKNKTKFSGLPYYLPIITDYSSAKIFTITPEYKYRPDKICNEIWSDQDLVMILDYINKFHHIEDYYIGRNVYYFDYEELSGMGLLR